MHLPDGASNSLRVHVYLSVCGWEMAVYCSCTLLTALIDGYCLCRPTFLTGSESEHRRKQKTEDCDTLHYKAYQDTVFCTVCIHVHNHVHTHAHTH